MSDCGGYGNPNNSACSSKFLEFVNSSYNTPQLYTERVCRSYLLAWKDCIIGPTGSSNVVINASQEQAVTEQMLLDTFQVIGKCLRKFLYAFLIIMSTKHAIVPSLTVYQELQ